MEELNVRTYVHYNGVPGVWFFSLDAARLPAVFAARATFGLPYYWAQMRVRVDHRNVNYQSIRGRQAAAVDYCDEHTHGLQTIHLE